MKKLLLILLLAISAPAMADKFIIERSWVDDFTTPTSPRADSWYFKGVIDYNKNLAFDSSITITQLDAAVPNNKISTRVDVGVIPKMNLYGTIDGYTRFAYGEKWSTSSPGNYDYYSVEPGIRSTLGYGFWGQLGWRYRAPFNDAINDTTRTWRTSLNYDVTAKDTVGVRLDNVRGSQNQNIFNVNYVRSF
jgi:hypothetical protein